MLERVNEIHDKASFLSDEFEDVQEPPSGPQAVEYYARGHRYIHTYIYILYLIMYNKHLSIVSYLSLFIFCRMHIDK